MSFSIENTGELQRKLTVQIPEDEIQPKVQSRLQSLSKTANVQGFRPGKVPMKIIQSRYGVQVRQEVVGQLVQSSYEESIREENLRPAGMPTIDPLDDKAGEGVEYTAIFEVMPEVSVNPVEQLQLEQPTAEVTADDVDKLIDTLRKQRGELKTVEREAKMNDTLLIDFTGTLDGEPFAGNSADDFKLELGSQQLIDGFEQGLVGTRAGEQKNLNLSFPDDYHAAEFAGKAVVFDVTVKAVQESELPELNEAFFAEFGVESGGLEAFKNTLKDNMQRELAVKTKEMARDNILDALIEANSVTLPEVLVDNEAQRLLEEMKGNLQRQGIPTTALDKVDTSAYREQAKKRVSLQFILSEIIKQNDMKADPAKVRGIIESQAQNYDDPDAVVNWYYADPQRLADVESMALEEDMVNWVLEKANITEKKMTFDEVMNKGQTA